MCVYFKRLRKYHLGYPKITTVNILVWDCLNVYVQFQKLNSDYLVYIVLYFTFLLDTTS